MEQKINALKIPTYSLPTLNWKKALPTTNKEQLDFSEKLNAYLSELKELETQLKTSKDAFSEIWSGADKLVKLKNDKVWAELELTNLTKVLDELQQNWKTAVGEVNYWCTNIHWLQSRFPEAKYADVVGLCKIADKMEYADEQDYSLNSGRYVGVYIEEDKLTKEEFKSKLDNLISKLIKLNNDASSIMKRIETTEIC
ncbi:MAG: hypothetical protein IPN14_08390 [Bacteroidetes bacterium]|nr:hypothetical protein [Bacteroidota bacterium]